MPRPLLSVRDVRELLASHALVPRRAAGQNFVVDPNTIRKTVRDAGVVAGDLVVEIGPGLGSLTLGLRHAGARVVAVEVDRGLATALAEVLERDPEVTIVHADGLRTDLAALVDRRRAKLVANLPYNLATPLLFHALDARVFDLLHLMVQKEVGQRWVAPAGHPLYSAVSVKLAALADAALVAPVSRTAFYPVPNVDSVAVRLVPRSWSAPVGRRVLFELVEAGFGQRRKRLRNALASERRPPGAIEGALRAADLDPGARAEQLSPREWQRLAQLLDA